MAQIGYPAIIERAGSGYSVFFPDLPGCTSAGDTIEEAARNAGEALAMHLASIVDHGEQVTAPTALDDVSVDVDVVEVTRLIVSPTSST